ncbi:MAG TPA: hypothetical protein VL595_34080 [Pseudonocardia sp.]|jgi:hypothetical protein|nr:hypothetical protein [Pseudonocardia sp.]
MRNNTRRALRATATVAGVAALAGTFAGTAFADSGLGGLGGGDNSFGGSDSHGISDFGGSDGKSIVDEPGLATFEMPGIGMGSRGMRTDGIPLLDALDGGDNEDGPFQHPVDNQGGNYGNVNFLGHDMGSSYKSKSIGSRSFRTDDSGFGDFGGLGGSSSGEDYSQGLGDGDFFSHDNSRSDSDSYGTDDADGLSGHNIKLPLGT